MRYFFSLSLLLAALGLGLTGCGPGESTVLDEPENVEGIAEQEMESEEYEEEMNKLQ
jgi:hypothetical protein